MPNGQVELDWGDGRHIFNIAKHAQVFELEEKCKAGVAEIYERIQLGRWRIDDIRETIRLALIGGGMKPLDALTLVRRYFDDRPWAESINVALVVLMSAMVGVPGDNVKKEDAEQTATEGSVGPLSAPQSMAQEPSLDGHPEKLTNVPHGNWPQQSPPTIEPKEEMRDQTQ